MKQFLAARGHLLRPAVTWAGLAILLPVLLLELSQLPNTLPLFDFIRYWTAGRLNATGGNPYSAEEVLKLQQEVGWSADQPLLMWNPPWTLTLAMPFGLLPYQWSRFLCLLIQFVITVACAEWAWRYYGGPVKRHWVSWFVAFSFYPVIVVLIIGQISLLVLLSLSCFLQFEKDRQWWLAGAAASLGAVKPHLAYLFWIALLVWSIDRRHWSLLLGGAVTILIAVAIPWLCNPSVVDQYWQALRDHNSALDHPSIVFTPTLGTWLRIAMGNYDRWIQFVPTAGGLIWFVLLWQRRRHTWSWHRELPYLLFASCLTTFYGAWVLDLVVLMIPLTQMAVWIAHGSRWWMTIAAVAFHVSISLLVFTMRLMGFQEHYTVWIAPALLLAYLGLSRGIGRDFTHAIASSSGIQKHQMFQGKRGSGPPR